jgi:hypothetical protein
MSIPRNIDPGAAPLLWSTIEQAFRDINQNFTEIYATIADDGSTQVVDFTNLSTDVSPSLTEIYDLGAPTRRWKDLYLGGSSLYLGDAVITATGTSVNLPAGSTIAGSVLDNEYFKTIAVAGQSDIVADAGGEDILTVVAGNSGISLTTNATTDTLTITNSGVIGAVAGPGMSVSAATGTVTFTNSGVTSLTAGQGVSLNSSTGSITVTNSGLIGIDPGIGITVSAVDPITGLVTVTNSQPNIPQNVFNTIAVPTQSDVVADSTTDTLTIQTSGNGLSITTDSSTDTITFANTGVHSLAVGNGLTASAGTGSINLTLDATLSRNIVGDIVGSVFSDNSSLIVDAVDNKVFASGGFFGNVTGNVTGNADSATVATTVTLVATEAVAGTYYLTFVDTTTGNENIRTDSGLNYNPNTNTLTTGTFVGDLTGTVTGNVFTSLIDSSDSSAITVTPPVIFSTDVTFENDLTVAERLTVKGGRVINLTELKAVVAASADFADFKTRIAALT